MKLKNNSFTKKKEIVVNTAWQYLGKSLNLLLVFISTFCLRRYFGRSGYGEYAYIFAYVSVFAVFSDFGTRLATVPKASVSKKQDELLGISITLRFLLTVLAFNFYCLGVLFFSAENNLRLSLLAAGGLLFVFWLKDSFYMIFAVKMRLDYQVAIELGVGGLMALAVFATVLGQKDLVFLYSFYFIFPIIFLMIFWFSNRITRSVKWLMVWSKTKRLARQSSQVFLTLFIFTLTSQLPILALKHWGKVDDLGIYSLSFKVYENSIFPIALFMNVCLPVFSRIKKQPESKAFVLLQNIFDGVILVSLAMMLAVILFAPMGIKVLTGDYLAQEILTIRLLAVAMVVSYFNHFYGFLFLGLGWLKKLVMSKLIGLGIGLLVLWPFIRLFGFIGAVGYIFLVELAVLLYSQIVVRQRLDFKPVLSKFPGTMWKIISSKGRVLIK